MTAMVITAMEITAMEMAATEQKALDFTVLLPPGWVRIPVDGRAPLRVKQLVSERLGAAPAEHREALRTGLTRELTAALETAGRVGGLDVFLSVDPVAGQPVPASGLVTHAEGPDDGDALDSILGTLVAGSDGATVRELTVVEVAGGPAVRRLSTRSERVAAEAGLPGGVLRVTQVDHFVPVPGGHGVLVLTFSTPIEQLGPPLVALFDVLASSMRWVRG